MLPCHQSPWVDSGRPFGLLTQTLLAQPANSKLDGSSRKSGDVFITSCSITCRYSGQLGADQGWSCGEGVRRDKSPPKIPHPWLWLLSALGLRQADQDVTLARVLLSGPQ
jgi:hypothetical protein